MRTSPSLAVSALLALIAGTAQATVLSSAPIEGYPSDQTLSCNIVNLNMMPRTVTIVNARYSEYSIGPSVRPMKPIIHGSRKV